MMMRPQKISFLNLFVATIVVLLYFWTATQGHFAFSSRTNSDGHLNLLAKSMSSGRLDLNLTPTGGPVPHDRKSQRFSGYGKVLDSNSFTYQGKWYLVDGFFPSLLIYLPYQFIFHADLSDALAGFLLASMTFSFGLALILRICGDLWILFSIPTRVAVILALGCGNVILYNLRSISDSQISLLWAQAFLSASIYFLYRGCEKRPQSGWELGRASFFLGLAIGAIQSLIWLLPILLIPVVSRRHFPWRFSSTDAFLLLLPCSICVVALATYNFARFNSYTDDGSRLRNSFSLTAPFSRKWIEESAPLYIIASPVYKAQFPFIFPQSGAPDDAETNRSRFEHFVGLVPSFPAVLLSLIIPLVLLIRRLTVTVGNEADFTFPSPLLFLLTIPALEDIILTVANPFVSLKFLALFDFQLIVLALAMWLFGLLKVRQECGWRSVVLLLGMLSISASLLSGLAFGIEGGDGGGLLRYNKRQFAILANLFWFVGTTDTSVGNVD